MKKSSPQLAVDVYDYIKVTFLDKELMRFLIVGGIVFVSNEMFLFFFHGLLKIPLLASQIISSELATIISFALHHHWTYKRYNPRPLYIRFLHFNLTALGGIIIANVVALACDHWLGINYLIGFSIGALVAIFWNYFANKHFIWAQNVDD